MKQHSEKIHFIPQPGKSSFSWLAGLILVVAALPACTGVNTFPLYARAGDTVSVMVGGSEKARKETVSVMLTDVNNQSWNLKSTGLVRSLFNLRPDGRAHGLHYSGYLESDVSWMFRHEPAQTMLVIDIPANVAPGAARLTVSLNADDNSSGIADPFTVNLEILPGVGNQDQFLRQDSLSGTSAPVNFAKLEPAPHARITFPVTAVIGAASLKIAFDNTVLDGKNINVYSPESTVRPSNDAFGKTQRMVYWRQDGQNLYVDIVAPQGISGKYLQFYVMHPNGLTGQPGFSVVSAAVYGVDGAPISSLPALEYFP